MGLIFLHDFHREKISMFFILLGCGTNKNPRPQYHFSSLSITPPYTVTQYYNTTILIALIVLKIRRKQSKTSFLVLPISNVFSAV